MVQEWMELGMQLKIKNYITPKNTFIKMKNRIFLNIFLLLSTLTFSQQKITYGIKAGVNLTGFHTDNGTNSDLIGFHIGGLAKMELNKTFDLQTELNLNTKGGIFVIPMTPKSPEIKLTYLNIPVLLKTKITPKFSFDAGPEFGFLISQKAELNGETFDISDVSSFDLNLNAGLSYEFENGIVTQARYGYGFTQLFDGEDYKNSCISFSLGYFFK